jgi:hypothetical protein
MILKEFTASLNIKADVPTINGHIYPREVLEDSLPLFVNVPIHHGISSHTNSVVGFVKKAFLEEDGEVMIDGSIRENLYEALTSADGALGLSISCSGMIKEKEGTVVVEKIKEVHRLHAMSRRMVRK